MAKQHKHGEMDVSSQDMHLMDLSDGLYVFLVFLSLYLFLWLFLILKI